MRSAIRVLGLHVLDPRLFKFEKAIAFPAVVMVETLYVVLPLCVEAPKVDVTAFADPVCIGRPSVLLQGLVV